MIWSSRVFASSKSSRAAGWAQDRRVLALEFPGEEEELPVDHAAQPGQVRLDGSDAGERRDGQVVERDPVRVRAGLLDGQQGTLPRVLVLFAQAFLIGAVADGQRLGPVAVEQVGDHADDAGRVEHVNGGAVIGRGDPHRGVLA